ncbi:uncharacterized protein LOC127286488 [Leptopilina boulardi]|uniref:uncharacterized protein LOC127286488 n=1 Tax=Leptopilina boulardi TaxID=63433 RepID=UPI0021F55A69|nr:uncharacterized protein LOC127286488 [Leptopilina boulardi]
MYHYILPILFIDNIYVIKTAKKYREFIVPVLNIYFMNVLHFGMDMQPSVKMLLFVKHQILMQRKMSSIHNNLVVMFARVAVKFINKKMPFGDILNMNVIVVLVFNVPIAITRQSNVVICTHM